MNTCCWIFLNPLCFEKLCTQTNNWYFILTRPNSCFVLLFNLSLYYSLQLNVVVYLPNQPKQNLLATKTGCTSYHKLDYRKHTAPLFSKLEILDTFKVNTLEIAKFMFCFHNGLLLPVFLSLLWQTVKFIGTTQEQLVIMECILVALTSRNSQVSTKD